MSNTEKLRDMSDEQLKQIAGGGDCSLTEVQTALTDLKQSYETLVDFTSYVIERIANS